MYIVNILQIAIVLSYAVLHERMAIMSLGFFKGDFIVYGKNGICFIDDVRIMDFAGEKGEYYVLKPKANSSSTLYVPLNNEKLTSRMRPIITKDKIDLILENSKIESTEWIDSKNERLEYFNSVVAKADTAELLLLVCSIYIKKKEKLADGKHLSTTDETILKTAERLIEEEFAFALECSNDRAVKYIKDKLGV